MKKRNKILASRNNINAIAETAGVSLATVSRVLNRKHNVSAIARKKVIRAAQLLNYEILPSGKQDTIAVVADEIEKSANMPRHLLLTNIFFHLSINNIPYEVLDASHIDEINTSFYKAVIYMGFLEKSDKKISKIKVPVIGINQGVSSGNFIGTDHAEGIRIGINYLVEQGHRKIGFIKGTFDSWGTKERLRGYCEGLSEHGIEYDSKLVQTEEECGIVGCIGRLLSKDPTAIIVSGENWGMQAVYALSLFNKKIPDDISLITFEHLLYSAFSTPPSTTIDQQFNTICQEIVHTIKDIFNNKCKFPVQRIIPSKLIVRDSVKMLSSK